MKIRAACLGLLACAFGGPVEAAAPGLQPFDSAVLTFEQGRLEAALPLLKKARIASPQDPRVPLLQGLCLRHLKRPAEAAAALKAAVRLDPLNFEAALNLGLAYFDAGQWSRAAGVFEDSAKAFPARPEPWAGLGMVEAGRRRVDRAKAAFEKALSLNPKNPGNWAALSDVLLSLGQLKAAAEARDKARIPGLADPELDFKRAALWYGAADYARAEAALEEAGSLATAEAFYLRGCLQYRRGQLDAAVAQFKAALETREDYPSAGINLGIAHYTAERYKESMAAFSEVLERHPGHQQAGEFLRAAREMAVDRLLREGSLAVLAMEPARAVEAWGKAAALAENPAAIERMLASLRERQRPQAALLAASGTSVMAQGRLEEAVKLWSEALKIDPENPEAQKGFSLAGSKLEALKGVLFRSLREEAGRDAFAAARSWAARLAVLDPQAGLAAEKEIALKVKARVRDFEAAADAHLAQGGWTSAILSLQQALACDPSSLRMEARLSQAKAGLRRALGGLLAKAQELEAEKKPKEALTNVEAALALDPEDLEARQAADRLSALLKLKRLDPARANEVYYEGVYHYGAGNTQKALLTWRRGLEKFPDHALLKQAVEAAQTKLRSLAQLEGRP